VTQMNSGAFPAVAPYLKDPLVLIGFFLFLAFLFTRHLLSSKIIPPLPPGRGFRILRTILLYGFIIGLLLIVLGFAFKYRELLGQERQESQDRELRKRVADAAVNQAEKDRIERERQRKLEGEQRHQQEINTVRLLKEELNSNLKSVNEMRKNTETALSTMLAVAGVLRTPGIKILPVLFPAENLDPKFDGTPALASSVMEKLGETGLAKDTLEVQKFTAAGRLVAGTVDKTIATVRKRLVNRIEVRAVCWAVVSGVGGQRFPVMRQ